MSLGHQAITGALLSLGQRIISVTPTITSTSLSFFIVI